MLAMWITDRVPLQLEFLKFCLKYNSIDLYLSNRNTKYLNQQKIIQSKTFSIENESFQNSLYFKGWLSGFIEAEGCFSIRKNNNHSFSIGQNDDYYLINLIKDFFEANNLVRKTNGKFFSIEIYKKETLKKIINHFNDYPLLGEKFNSLQKFNSQNIK